jgi:hypothetical protein
LGQRVRRSIRCTRSDGATCKAVANFHKVVNVGWRTPRSSWLTKVRSTPASRASFSCDSLSASRWSRSTRPNATDNCAVVATGTASRLGDYGSTGYSQQARNMASTPCESCRRAHVASQPRRNVLLRASDTFFGVRYGNLSKTGFRATRLTDQVSPKPSRALHSGFR